MPWRGRRGVLFDSGIRSGSVKALVEQPYVYGRPVGGADGVSHVLRCLLAELDMTIAVSGDATLRSLDCDLLVQVGTGAGVGAGQFPLMSGRTAIEVLRRPAGLRCGDTLGAGRRAVQ